MSRGECKVYSANARIIQEELTKEERQDSYATWLLKGVAYVSSCSRSHVRRRSAPSIYIGCNPLHYPPLLLLCLVRGPILTSSCLYNIRKKKISYTSISLRYYKASAGSFVFFVQQLRLLSVASIVKPLQAPSSSYDS
jgi:hypothetical protein